MPCPSFCPQNSFSLEAVAKLVVIVVASASFVSVTVMPIDKLLAAAIPIGKQLVAEVRHIIAA